MPDFTESRDMSHRLSSAAFHLATLYETDDSGRLSATASVWGIRAGISTGWTNHASLAIAPRLGLVAYASTWSIA